MSEPFDVEAHRTNGEIGLLIEVAAYWVSRLSDSNADHPVWSVKVEAAGHGRWAVRNMSRCLNKAGTWEYEPQPSSREDDWLDTVRWDDVDEALAAAVDAEPHIRWNGLTPADVLARQNGGRRQP
jgi:hypothetical protein